MTEPEDFELDPVFNDDEGQVPLPVGGGPTMTAGEFIERDALAPEGGESRTTGGVFRQMSTVFVENKLAVAGIGVIIFMVLFCFVGPHLYPTNQTNAQLVLQNSTSNAPPGNGHPLGTDETGYDMLGRLMFGGQASLIVGFASALVATIFGTLYGAVSGFFGNWLDSLLMRVVDVFLSIPVLFLLIALVTIYHQSEVLLILVIAFVSWLIPARLIRGETLSLRNREYVQAVRVMGGAGSGSSAATSSRTPSAPSWSSPPSRSPTRSCCWRPSGSSGSGSRPPRPTGGPCSPTGWMRRPAATGGRSTRPASASCWWWWPSTTWATPSGTRWRSGSSSAERSPAGARSGGSAGAAARSSRRRSG